MKPTVVWSERALRESERALAWWAKNRELAPDLLLHEIAGTLEFLRTTPEGGVPHDARGRRRVELLRTRYGMIYTYDAATGRVEILAFWSSLRGHKPRLRRP